MDELAIKIEHVSKQYRLGAIGGGTLQADLQSWWARKRGKEDPNSKIGARTDIKVGEKFLALDDINLEVKKGEALGIIGHNGAGKSTLLKLLSRVTAPTRGTISYDGRIASMLEVGTGFHGELTGRENIYMNGAILGMTKAEINKKIEQIIDFSEVRQFIDTPVKRYSSGMYVKLAFSVAAHLDSEIMIMDEVLAVGDMAFQKKCLTKMREAADKEGRTVLYVSHNMNTIRQLCDRCIVLDQGRIIFDGDVAEAISLYLGAVQIQLSNMFNLDCMERTLSNHGSVCKLTAFELSGKKEAEYNMGERLPFTLSVRSAQKLSDVCIRMMVYYNDAVPVAMASTVSGDLNFSSGITKVQGELDISHFAPGDYWIKLAVYSVNDIGIEEHYDVLDRAVFFRVNDNTTVNNMTWLHKWWGHVRLENITVHKVLPQG